jgi:hypothetical protein
MQIVERQAQDEGLWCVAQTAPEAYLQQELRRLHAAVETQQKVLRRLYEEMAGANLDSPQSMRMNIPGWTNRIAVELSGSDKQERS